MDREPPAEVQTDSAAARHHGGLAWLATIALVLLIIGGVNWGLVGLFGLDVVAEIFGPMSAAARVIYVLVGLAAVYCIVRLPRWSKAS